MMTANTTPGRTRPLDAARELSEVHRRMQRPQRHRLVHGYPRAAAMPRIAADRGRDPVLPESDPGRGLLVGVLPHPSCNPAVAGCEFCTFPHEVFCSLKAAGSCGGTTAGSGTRS
jgi:oxygen-independent coproporphyrinogen-3 oxidase